MSDYILQATWSTKDALSTGAQLKAISATELGNEFDAIAAASATKYDSTDLADQTEAELQTETTKLLSPKSLDHWSNYQVGIIGDLYDITGLAAGGDKLFFFDDTDDTTKALTVGTGLAITGTTIATDDSAIVLSGLSGYVANEHINHTSVTLTAGNGLTGGGDISDNRSFAVGAGDGITVNADDVALASSTAGVGLAFSAGVLSLDGSELTAFSPTSVDLDVDEVLGLDNGSDVRIGAAALLTPETPTEGTANFQLAEHDFGKVVECTGTAQTVTLPDGLKDGFWCVLYWTGASGSLTLSAATTLNTADGLTSTATRYSAITVVHLGSNVWTAFGGLTS